MSTVTIPGLFKRKGIWTYRRVIMPRHPAPIIGRTEIVVSLRTRDLGEAIARAEVERKKADAVIAEAKKIAHGERVAQPPSWGRGVAAASRGLEAVVNEAATITVLGVFISVAADPAS